MGAKGTGKKKWTLGRRMSELVNNIPDGNSRGNLRLVGGSKPKPRQTETAIAAALEAARLKREARAAKRRG